MRYVALAAGFDGTLARNGRYDERCAAALRALAATGRKLILVTARELRELLEIFPLARVFDYIVAENGAVMHQPATRESEILAQAPSEALLQELQRRKIAPLNVGSSIVTTSIENECEVRNALQKLQLDCQLAQNEGTLIVLPAEVNKASGVEEALKQLGVSQHNLVVIGDAQNDLALFDLAEHAVAVQNADPLLKRVADRITHGAYCEGFLELARDLMVGDLAYAQPKIRIELGRRAALDDVTIAPYYDSLLVCGASGKAAFCNRLFEKMLVHGYQCCIVGADLSGAHRAPAGVREFGQSSEVPRLSEIMSALEQPETSVAVNLAALPAETRPVFTAALLLQLQALHDRVGRPHSVLVHQAHWFLMADALPATATRLAEMTMVYATAEPDRLPSEILERVQTVISLDGGRSIPRQLAGLGEASWMQLEYASDSKAKAARIAQVWIRGQRSDSACSALNAIAGEADCEASDPRAGADLNSAPSSNELRSLSEY